MESLILTIHVIACLILIMLVLLQSGQEGMGIIFGGGSSSVFGSSGAGGLLVKITAALAVLFLLTSLTYNKLTGSTPVETDSLMRGAAIPQEAAQPEQEQAKPAVTFEEPQTEGAEQTQ